MTPSPQYLVLAQVLRPHGVRGTLLVKILTSYPERLNDLEVIYFGKDPNAAHDLKAIHPISIKRHKGDQWLVQLEELADREAAERWRNGYFFVSLADAVPLEPDEVYLFQVIGLEARTESGETLGRVASLIETGANDVLVIRDGPYGEVLIPAIPSVVLKIDVDAGFVLIRPLPGLLPES